MNSNSYTTAVRGPWPEKPLLIIMPADLGNWPVADYDWQRTAYWLVQPYTDDNGGQCAGIVRVTMN